MPGIKKKKCRHCQVLFIPNPRNKDRQCFCRKPDCRKASKANSQRRWLDKPDNRDYFCGPEHVQRVQHWRKDNPGYWRPKPRGSLYALQDSLNRQPFEKTIDNADFANRALQDLLTQQPSVLIGIIAQLTGYALQDDIAMAARRMQQLGDDILNPQREGGRHGMQTTRLSRPYP
jgi:hypothetical protein